MKFDYQTGKLLHVATARRENRRREYGLLITVGLLSSLPYLAAMVHYPLATIIVMSFMGYFQVMMTFATSTSTDTAHAVRFLLAGSNPIGMTGSSSLLFGAVDAIIDWREDAIERRGAPWKTWALTVYKFAMTPIGCLLMIVEFFWDIVLLRRPSIVRHKWSELFSLAYYHDLVCPEKSNDIFYADLAFAKYQDDAQLYQWNRLRCLVFEFEHCRIDAVQGLGEAATNVFMQSELAAYQTLKRLQLESIEHGIRKQHQQNEGWFPFPRNLANNLISNARPIGHYLRMRRELLSNERFACPFDKELSQLLGEHDDLCYRTWHVLRLMDSDHEFVTLNQLGEYFDQSVIDDLQRRGIASFNSEGQIAIDGNFRAAFDALVTSHLSPISTADCDVLRLSPVPDFLVSRGQAYATR